jgi:hypothetical protein
LSTRSNGFSKVQCAFVCLQATEIVSLNANSTIAVMARYKIP